MAELTVGVVSGIIAAAVHVGKKTFPLWRLHTVEGLLSLTDARTVQIFGPMALALILVALVPERHSALTWCVFRCIPLVCCPGTCVSGCIIAAKDQWQVRLRAHHSFNSLANCPTIRHSSKRRRTPPRADNIMANANFTRVACHRSHRHASRPARHTRARGQYRAGGFSLRQG